MFCLYCTLGSQDTGLFTLNVSITSLSYSEIMSTAGNIGFGLLTLLILWILTLIIFVIAIKLQSNIAWIALGLTSAVTIVLLVIPTEKPEDTPQLGDVVSCVFFLEIFTNSVFCRKKTI